MRVPQAAEHRSLHLGNWGCRGADLWGELCQPLLGTPKGWPFASREACVEIAALFPNQKCRHRCFPAHCWELVLGAELCPVPPCSAFIPLWRQLVKFCLGWGCTRVMGLSPPGTSFGVLASQLYGSEASSLPHFSPQNPISTCFILCFVLLSLAGCLLL